MRHLANLSDTELIANLRNGQEQAFDVLFRRYHKDIRNVILHYTKDRLITEDLSQDTFIKIYTSLKGGKYAEQGSFLPWALRIARNLCMDYLRKESQFSRSAKIIHDDCLFTTANQGAEAKLSAKQQDQQLHRFINRLPDDQKKVVHYRFFEELTFKEIAGLMNTSVNTSLGRMRYGVMHLRKQVAQTPSFVWR